MEARPAHFWPLKGKMCARLRQQWEALRHGGRALGSRPSYCRRDQHAHHRKCPAHFQSASGPVPLRRPSAIRVRGRRCRQKDSHKHQQLCLLGICCVAHSLAHSASTRAEGCQILHRHAAPAQPLAAALQHGRDSVPAHCHFFC
jgi:hypothetical protein